MDPARDDEAASANKHSEALITSTNMSRSVCFAVLFIPRPRSFFHVIEISS